MWGDDPEDFEKYQVQPYSPMEPSLPSCESLSCGCEVNLTWPKTVASSHPVSCVATGIVPCKFHRGGNPEAEKQAYGLAKELYRRYVERFVKSNEL